MKPETRKLLHSKYYSRLALGYGVSLAGTAESPKIETFAATPAVAQSMVDAVQLNSDFLTRINMLGVTQQQGEAVINLFSGPGTKRTNTAVNPRVPANRYSNDTNTYACVKAEFDISIPYALLDSWAKFPDLAARIRRAANNQRSLDIITAGWYGTSVAAVTNIGTNPLLQDLNKGWLQKARDYNGGSQVLKQGGTTNQIRIGAGGDYVNLDAAVHDCRQLIDERFHDDADLVAIMGRDLLALEKARLYTAQGSTPTEKERIENAQVIGTFGGLPTMTVPKFPPRGLVITSLSNLSYYWQDSSLRQAVKDMPENDCINEFSSVNQDFVIEERDKFAAFEFANVKVPGPGGTWV